MESKWMILAATLLSSLLGAGYAKPVWELTCQVPDTFHTVNTTTSGSTAELDAFLPNLTNPCGRTYPEGSSNTEGPLNTLEGRRNLLSAIRHANNTAHELKSNIQEILRVMKDGGHPAGFVIDNLEDSSQGHHLVVNSSALNDTADYHNWTAIIRQLFLAHVRIQHHVFVIQNDFNNDDAHDSLNLSHHLEELSRKSNSLLCNIYDILYVLHLQSSANHAQSTDPHPTWTNTSQHLARQATQDLSRMELIFLEYNVDVDSHLRSKHYCGLLLSVGTLKEISQALSAVKGGVQSLG